MTDNRAGYSPKTAKAQAARLLTNVNVQQRIQQLRNEQQKRVQVTADYVLTTIVETIMGTKVESFVIEDKADIIAAKAKKPTRSKKELQDGTAPEAWTADWARGKYSKLGYTASGSDRGAVIADVTDKIKHRVIAYHLREWFEVRKAQEILKAVKEC